MKIIDNINTLWGDDLKQALKPGTKLKIAASCFSIYAYEALKDELEQIDELEFIFTAPAFIPNEVTDKIPKERREFYIPKLERERSLYGSEFEIHLKNKLTQKAIAKECASWIQRKTKFKSNATNAPMQQFACLKYDSQEAAYAPLNGFTAVDLGYQQGNAVSNLVNKIDEAPLTTTYLQLFDQIWKDESKLKDVTQHICDHIKSVYQENSPEKIYFLMLYNIFNEFLEDLNEDILPNDMTGYLDSAVWHKKLLDLARSGCKGLDSPITDLCRKFNSETKDGRDMSFYSDLLNKAITSMIEVQEDKDIDSLFIDRETTALTDTIKGLDDFELICFMVIRG